MRIYFTLIAVFISIIIFGQYNYGLEICDQDVKVEGRLYLNDEFGNTYIGSDAGRFSSGTGNNSSQVNVAIGNDAGLSITDGDSNTFIGYGAGRAIKTGAANAFLGGASGLTELGSRNVYLGAFTAFVPGNPTITRTGNVFIGFAAGGYEVGSNKLYIENSDSSSPLIYGEFDNDKIQINGSFHIRDALQLFPQTPPSGSCTANGEMVYGTDNELYLCKSSIWKQILTN